MAENKETKKTINKSVKTTSSTKKPTSTNNKTSKTIKTKNPSEVKKTPVVVKKTNTPVETKTLQFSKELLNDKLFGLETVHTQAIFDTVLSDRASRRLSTHAVKNRGHVSGTGKKPWQQKGTGRARTGSLRSPIFVGGGRAFGPTTAKNYSLKVNKKIRSLAVRSALSQLAKAKQVFVYEFKLKKPSTSTLVEQLKELKLNNNKVLIVTSDLNVFLSARNLNNVKTLKVTSLSVEELLATDCLLISEKDLKILESLVK
ncbi:50S ribosomal protein L4 [Mycoplasma miroungirhinis]|uniref:Large ribosomal subunit protein uL4 n=1 Tax=Mycoplasma miroungirhinis TaxID=754516 RepID=A0A6M4JD44_9MOLU|nr:50S ribosomal protein L4 [Mycoplasma miroungirhinis]QJR43966.1 50S ribosomal protein L4 [Mycoplasma miroungirhinis]